MREARCTVDRDRGGRGRGGSGTASTGGMVTCWGRGPRSVVEGMDEGVSAGEGV